MIQRDLMFISQQPTYILSELCIILLLLITFIFDYLLLDLQHTIGSWHIIVLFVLVYVSFCTLSLLCFLPTIVCAAADSIIYQIALLPFNNGLRSSRQCCSLGYFAPFQQQSLQLQIVFSSGHFALFQQQSASQ